jgi:hypothetical protein
MTSSKKNFSDELCYASFHLAECHHAECCGAKFMACKKNLQFSQTLQRKQILKVLMKKAFFVNCRGHH